MNIEDRFQAYAADFELSYADDDTVVVQWTARYTSTGLPALEINGTEFARFEGNAIAELRDEISEESQAVFGAWMEAYGGAL